MPTKWVAQYTHQKLKKRKTWQDGYVMASEGVGGKGKASLFSEDGKYLDEHFVRVEPDSEYEFDKFLVMVEAPADGGSALAPAPAPPVLPAQKKRRTAGLGKVGKPLLRAHAAAAPAVRAQPAAVAAAAPRAQLSIAPRPVAAAAAAPRAPDGGARFDLVEVPSGGRTAAQIVSFLASRFPSLAIPPHLRGVCAAAGGAAPSAAPSADDRQLPASPRRLSAELAVQPAVQRRGSSSSSS